MADRCTLWMTYRKEDEEKFTKVLGENWYDRVEDEGKAWRTVFVEQASYGLLEERVDLARREKLCFTGEHGAGHEYPAAVFAAFGGDHMDVPALQDRMVAFLTEDGDVEAMSVVHARRYLDLAEKAEEHLGVEWPRKPLKEYYQLVRIHKDVEPDLVGGRSEPTKDALREMVIDHLRLEPLREDEDSLFCLHIRGGKPVDIFPFATEEMEEMRKAAEEEGGNSDAHQTDHRDGRMLRR